MHWLPLQEYFIVYEQKKRLMLLGLQNLLPLQSMKHLYLCYLIYVSVNDHELLKIQYAETSQTKLLIIVYLVSFFLMIPVTPERNHVLAIFLQHCVL